MATERYAKLRALIAQDGESVRDILQRAVDRLHNLGEKATLQVRLTDTDGRTTTGARYSIFLTPGRAYLHAEGDPEIAQKVMPNPTFAVTLNHDVFYQIADGSYSPVEAFLDSNMAVQGDVELGNRVLRHLDESSTEPGAQSPANSSAHFDCDGSPCITDGTWHIDGIGYGSLTIRGANAAEGGTIKLVYDYGGGQYRQLTTADTSGNFTATEGYLPCGPIPNQGDIGVWVTAYDLTANRASTRRGFPTPCH